MKTRAQILFEASHHHAISERIRRSITNRGISNSSCTSSEQVRIKTSYNVLWNNYFIISDKNSNTEILIFHFCKNQSQYKLVLLLFDVYFFASTLGSACVSGVRSLVNKVSGMKMMPASKPNNCMYLDQHQNLGKGFRKVKLRRMDKLGRVLHHFQGRQFLFTLYIKRFENVILRKDRIHSQVAMVFLVKQDPIDQGEKGFRQGQLSCRCIRFPKSSQQFLRLCPPSSLICYAGGFAMLYLYQGENNKERQMN